MLQSRSALSLQDDTDSQAPAAASSRTSGLSHDSGTTSSRLVQVQSVTKRYGAVTAVDDVSFDLETGQFLTILGPSGCGKSTLLRLMAGFLELSQGHILIAGQAVDKVPPYRRSIGMVFQRLALFQHMTVEENVAFPLRMRRFPPREIPERVDRYLKIVRLGGYQKRPIQALSGGQQQRVAIARALVFEPSLLLLDEPLAALDRKLREEMQLEFRRIQRELGVTTINVTHDQREALVMSDKILVMSDGRLQQFASPKHIYDRPANKFVADFVGQTNFARAWLVSYGGELRLRLGAIERAVSEDVKASLAGSNVVDFAIRAERIRIGSGARNLAFRFRGQIMETIFEGERMIYQVTVPDLDHKSFVVIGPEGPVFDTDGSNHIEIGWDENDMRFFPADGQSRSE